MPRFVPRNMDVDSHGRVVVASALTGKAVFFSPSGKVVAKPAIKVGGYAGVGLAPDGRVAIAPQVGDSIPPFSASGKHIGDYLPPPAREAVCAW